MHSPSQWSKRLQNQRNAKLNPTGKHKGICYTSDSEAYQITDRELITAFDDSNNRNY